MNSSYSIEVSIQTWEHTGDESGPADSSSVPMLTRQRMEDLVTIVARSLLAVSSEIRLSVDVEESQ